MFNILSKSGTSGINNRWTRIRTYMGPMGFEPTTFCLEGSCITVIASVQAELRTHA
ncbi:MAG: hypothetical protein J4428_00230 [Candidatus Aenigmarchaeota archaeon]|nr:hypothetical protein [Candidatus Aenigmarchaeota archaeon]